MFPIRSCLQKSLLNIRILTALLKHFRMPSVNNFHFFSQISLEIFCSYLKPDGFRGLLGNSLKIMSFFYPLYMAQLKLINFLRFVKIKLKRIWVKYFLIAVAVACAY